MKNADKFQCKKDSSKTLLFDFKVIDTQLERKCSSKYGKSSFQHISMPTIHVTTIQNSLIEANTVTILLFWNLVKVKLIQTSVIISSNT